MVTFDVEMILKYYYRYTSANNNILQLIRKIKTLR